MEKIKVAIIEDNKETIKYIDSVIQKDTSNFLVIGSSGNIEEAIKLIKEKKPEIILLDIELNDGNAFDILDRFPNPEFDIIFISGHAKYMSKALAYYGMNFILKPIDSKILLGSLSKYVSSKKRWFESYRYQMLKELVLEQGNTFLLQVGNIHKALAFNNVIRCEAEDGYTVFHMKNKDLHLGSKSLLFYEELLVKKRFFRINRSHLINLNHVDYFYKKEAVILSNGERISVSNRTRSKLNDLLKNISY